MIAIISCMVLATALLSGCAGSVPVRVERPVEAAPAPVPRDAFGGVPGKYRELAESAEKAGDLRRALLYRKVVDGFLPGDADARDHVERLEMKIRGEAAGHYKAAMALEKSGETSKALREFLAVLVLDPDNEEALRRVKSGRNAINDRNGKSGRNGKNGRAAAGSRFWKVREGDTLRKIAGEAYRDPDKDFLIAWFNRLEAGSALSVGTELELPDIDIGASKTAEKGSAYSVPDKEGNDLRNAAQRKEDAERKLREADAHYAAGMRRFLAEDLDGAIREWGMTLSLDPAHQKARRDIEKARRLKGRIETPK